MRKMFHNPTAGGAALAAVLVMTVLAATALAGEVGSDRNEDFSFKPPSAEDMQAAMGAWQATMQPTIYHERLAYFIGEWDTVTKMWFGGPGAPPSESRGKATFKWLFEGKWTAQEYEGEMMGMNFTGFGVTGFDNFRREYVTMWVDDMGTTMSVMSGRLDQTGEVITFYGQMDEPMTGDLGKAVKYVTRIIDDNKHTFEIHDLAMGGENTRVMEITYTRK